ncbi:hypothetical protein YC2023_059621 [Brassica napus]
MGIHCYTTVASVASSGSWNLRRCRSSHLRAMITRINSVPPTVEEAGSDRMLERDKIGAAPYDGCLRTLVEGIKPFIVRLGVKVRMTSFPARPLRSSFYVEVIRRVLADGILYGCRGKTTNARILAKRQILGSRIKVFDTMPRDVRDQCAGFRARPRFTPGFRGCDD